MPIGSHATTVASSTNPNSCKEYQIFYCNLWALRLISFSESVTSPDSRHF